MRMLGCPRTRVDTAVQGGGGTRAGFGTTGSRHASAASRTMVNRTLGLTRISSAFDRLHERAGAVAPSLAAALHPWLSATRETSDAPSYSARTLPDPHGAQQPARRQRRDRLLPQPPEFLLLGPALPLLTGQVFPGEGRDHRDDEPEDESNHD